MNRIAKHIISVRSIWFALFWGGLLLVLLPFLGNLRFDYDIEKFFPEGDEEVGVYREFLNEFENENDYLLVALSNDQSVFRPSFLQKVDRLSERLQKQKGVSSVQSPTNFAKYSKSVIYGYTAKPILHIDDSLRLLKDQREIESTTGAHRLFFSDDFKSVQLVVKIKPYNSQKDGFTILKHLKKTVNAAGFVDPKIAGRLQTQWFYVTEMKKEMIFFGSASLLLLTISLLLVFRRLKSMFFVLLGILLNLLIVFGVMGAVGQEIHLLLSILPAIVIIIGTSSMIHLLQRFDVNYHEMGLKLEALERTVKETFTPLLFNALTTAVGFGSLWLIPVEPIKTFGLFAALSVMIGFVITFFLLPFLIRMATYKKVEQRFKQLRGALSMNFSRRGISVLVMSLVVIGVFVFQATRLKTETFFLNDISDRSELKQELQFFEKHFSGIRPFELAIKYKGISNTTAGSHRVNPTRPSLDELKETEKLEAFIAKTYGVKFVLSPVTVVKSTHQAMKRGKTDFYVLPNDDASLSKVYDEIEKWAIWKRQIPLLSENGIGRMSARTKDEGSTTYSKRNQQLADFSAKLEHIKVQLTGVSYLMDKSILAITSYLIYGILTAILISTALIFFMTKSVRLALVSLIPNLIPLLYAAALMGFLEVPLNISTVTVFTIIYGIAVDDTMHFIYNYSNYRKTQSTDEAIGLTLKKVVRPMVYTSVVLFIGFALFAFSDFRSIFSLGVVVSSSLIVALLSDLFILPIVLRYIDRK